MITKLFLSILLITILLTLASCVSKSTYNDLQSKYDEIQQQFNNLQQQASSLQNTVQQTQDELSSINETLTTTREDLQSAQSQIKLYQDTFGAIVKQDIQPDTARGNDSQVHLTPNSKATNPTWQQLKDFLVVDDTDSHPYISFGSDSYICTDFAECLYNDAESRGIRASFVIIHYVDDPIGHAINAFMTTDGGLIYIDDTGEDNTPNPFLIPLTIPGWSTSEQFGNPSTWDKVAYIQIGKPYSLISLGTNYGATYSDYLQWQTDKNSFDLVLKNFNLWVDYHNSIGWWGSDQAQLNAYYDTMSNDIKSRARALGGFWEQGEDVESIEIFW